MCVLSASSTHTHMFELRKIIFSLYKSLCFINTILCAVIKCCFIKHLCTNNHILIGSFKFSRLDQLNHYKSQLHVKGLLKSLTLFIHSCQRKLLKNWKTDYWIIDGKQFYPKMHFYKQIVQYYHSEFHEFHSSMNYWSRCFVLKLTHRSTTNEWMHSFLYNFIFFNMIFFRLSLHFFKSHLPLIFLYLLGDFQLNWKLLSYLTVFQIITDVYKKWVKIITNIYNEF